MTTDERLELLEAELAAQKKQKAAEQEALGGSREPVVGGWKAKALAAQTALRDIRNAAAVEAGRLYELQLQRTQARRAEIEEALAALSVRERDERKRSELALADISRERTRLSHKLTGLCQPEVS